MRINNRGITLVALVVTILSIMIVVTVSINLTLEENSVIGRSKQAAIESEIEDVKEIFDTVQNEYLLKRARGYSKSNEEFLAEKGYINPETGEVLIGKILKKHKTGKGDLASLKDVYIYMNGSIGYYDKDGNLKVIAGVSTEGSFAGIRFEKLATKGGHVLAIDANGDLWGWGSNSGKQIENSEKSQITIAQRIDLGRKVIKCQVTSYGSIALDEDGNIWTGGKNAYGELGRGYTDNIYPVPEKLSAGVKFVDIATGDNNLYAIDENGKLYGCGYNYYYQLGGTDTNNVSSLKLLDDTKTFKQVAAGYRLMIALDTNDVAWTMGENYVSGPENKEKNKIFTHVKDNVKKVQAEGASLFVLTNNGEIWSCGNPSYGELGLNTGYFVYTITKIDSSKTFVDIFAEDSVLLAKDSEGLYWASGYNMYGNLLTGYTGDEGILKECKILNRIKNIKDVSSVSGNAFYIDNDGYVHAMGWNGGGQLGNGKVDSSWFGASEITEVYGYNGDYVKIAAGERETIAIDSKGDVYTWGANWDGECGYDSQYLYVNEPTKVPNLKAVEASSGCSTSGFIDTDGNLFMCGSNMDGSLGVGQDYNTLNGSAELLQVMPGTKFVKFSFGQSNAYAIDELGNLWAWGRNSYGELGDGTRTTRLAPVQIAAGTKFKDAVAGSGCGFALDEEGYLWSTGYNGNGTLGNGNYTTISTLTKVTDGRQYEKIAGFSDSLVAIDTEGNAYTCGKNSNGQLGDGSYNKRNLLTQVMPEKKFVACAASWDNNYLVDTDGNLWGAGNNSFGQLGTPYSSLNESNVFIKVSNGQKIIDVASTGGHYAALAEDGIVYAGGYNEFGECTRVLIPDDCFNIVKIRNDLDS